MLLKFAVLTFYYDVSVVSLFYLSFLCFKKSVISLNILSSPFLLLSSFDPQLSWMLDVLTLSSVPFRCFFHIYISFLWAAFWIISPLSFSSAMSNKLFNTSIHVYHLFLKLSYSKIYFYLKDEDVQFYEF